MFLALIAKQTGLPPEKITLHSPLLGGFFGRHFTYPDANPFPRPSNWPNAPGGPSR
jgi:isoquinoline 1-oxidoreductase beta subunit